MGAISRRMPVVTIEYDCRKVRVRKLFVNPYRARGFYGSKLKLGKNPKIVKDETSN